MDSPADSGRGDGVTRVGGHEAGNLDILAIAGRWSRRSV
jgi:hypothetical protein